MEVSNETLLEDICNTELESDAYDNIAEGFLVLSQLPENEGFQRTKYLREYNEYSSLRSECNRFLEKLYQLKRERQL